MSEIDRLLDELARTVRSLFEGGYRGGFEEGPVKVSLNVGYLDEVAVKEARKGPSPGEPLIDVIDEGRRVRIIVAFPGVKKDAVKVTSTRDRVRVEVSKGDTVFVKEMECAEAPLIVTPKSVENNSVVEIVFSKRRRTAGR